MVPKSVLETIRTGFLSFKNSHNRIGYGCYGSVLWIGYVKSTDQYNLRNLEGNEIGILNVPFRSSCPVLGWDIEPNLSSVSLKCTPTIIRSTHQDKGWIQRDKTITQ